MVSFHYTPTHASWVNLVECFFSILTRTGLQQQVHKSGKELERKRSTEHLSHFRERFRGSRSYATALSSAMSGWPWAVSHAAGSRLGSSSSAGLCMSLPKTHSK